jgi:excisionase family DNA binding protein
VSALVVVPLADGRWLALETAQFHDALDAARGLGLGPRSSSSQVAGTENEPLLNSEDMAKLLGIHSTTLESLAKAATIPSIRIGRVLRFEPSAVKAALRGHSS